MIGWTKRIAALLVGAAWSTGHADSHKDHGAMVSLDEVERIPRPNSPVGPVKRPAGFVAPDHAHTGDYHGETFA